MTGCGSHDIESPAPSDRSIRAQSPIYARATVVFTGDTITAHGTSRSEHATLGRRQGDRSGLRSDGRSLRRSCGRPGPGDVVILAGTSEPGLDFMWRRWEASPSIVPLISDEEIPGRVQPRRSDR